MPIKANAELIIISAWGAPQISPKTLKYLGLTLYHPLFLLIFSVSLNTNWCGCCDATEGQPIVFPRIPRPMGCLQLSKNYKAFYWGFQMTDACSWAVKLFCPPPHEPKGIPLAAPTEHGTHSLLEDKSSNNFTAYLISCTECEKFGEFPLEERNKISILKNIISHLFSLTNCEEKCSKVKGPQW